jgi:hypothetical protein
VGETESIKGNVTYLRGFEFLTAVVVKSSDITPCSPLKVNERFEEASLFYVIVRRLPTQDSVTWVNTLWNQVTTMTPP